METNSKNTLRDQNDRSILSKIFHFITKNRNRVALTIILLFIAYLAVDIALNWEECKTAFIEGWNSVE